LWWGDCADAKEDEDTLPQSVVFFNSTVVGKFKFGNHFVSFECSFEMNHGFSLIETGRFQNI
jgi:hypothetical protein